MEILANLCPPPQIFRRRVIPAVNLKFLTKIFQPSVSNNFLKCKWHVTIERKMQYTDARIKRRTAFATGAPKAVE